MNRIKSSLYAASMILMGTGQAFAHAYPKTEIPLANAMVKTSPSSVTINFTESVNRIFSKIVVKNENGTIVSIGSDYLNPTDAKMLSIKLLSSLPKGKYLVIWHALSTDGHITNGHYDFTIAP